MLLFPNKTHIRRYIAGMMMLVVMLLLELLEFLRSQGILER